jgi:hypothetical protein
LRKAVLAAAFLVLLLSGFLGVLFPPAQAADPTFSWTDHMDYSSLAEMEAAGWYVNTPAHTFLNQSCVVLEFVEPPTAISYRGYPSGVYEWRAEIRAMWTEGSGGSVGVNVVTENHSYGWSFDGWYSRFGLYRDSSVVMTFGSLTLERYRWYVMSMEMVDGTLSFYLDGVYVDSYIETDLPSQAVGMDSVSPWMSTAQYDYYHIEKIESGNAPATWASWRDVIGSLYSDTGYSAAPSGDGGYGLVGVTKPTGGLFDAYIVRVDYAGNVLWSRTYDKGSADYAYAIVNTSDGGFAIAGAAYNSTLSQYQVWLFKVDSNGEVIWDRLLGTGTWDVAFSMSKTADGGFALAGYKDGSDLYLIKTDSTGVVEWERTYGGGGNDWGKCVIQTADGGYAISGWTTSYTTSEQMYLVRTSSDGTMLWQSHFGNGSSLSYGLVEMPDGGFVMGGHTDGMGAGMADLYAVRTDSGGGLVWEKTYGGTSDEYGSSVFRVEGGLIFGGSTSSFGLDYSKVYMVATDDGGNMLWDTYLGLPNVTVSGSIAIHNSDGSFLAIGNTNTYDSGADDLFAMRVMGGGQATAQPIPSGQSLIQEAGGPVAAVAVGAGVGLLAVGAAGVAGNVAASAASGNAASSVAGGKSSMVRGFRFSMIEDFVTGYLKSHVSWKAFKYMGKVEPERGIAQERKSIFLTLSAYELMAIAFASVILGVTFMIAADMDLFRLDQVLIYIFFAGFVLIVDDLTHRYMARRYGTMTEYQFWFLGTIIMFVTAFLFGSVFALPGRTIINDAQKLTPKQRAVVYGAGPLMSFSIFVVFLLFIPLGGAIGTLAILGASMHLLSAVYSFMPFDPMDGNKVYRWRKLVWLAAFAPLLVLYFAMVIWVF